MKTFGDLKAGDFIYLVCKNKVTKFIITCKDGNIFYLQDENNNCIDIHCDYGRGFHCWDLFIDGVFISDVKNVVKLLYKSTNIIR